MRGRMNEVALLPLNKRNKKYDYIVNQLKYMARKKNGFEPRVMRPINTFYRPITDRVCFDNKLGGFAREYAV